jgi:hypothetical protein
VYVYAVPFAAAVSVNVVAEKPAGLISVPPR